MNADTEQEPFSLVKKMRACRAAEPFEPECLAISLGNRCNLACTYCYATARPRQTAPAMEPRAFLRVVRAAAELVATTSKQRKRQMVFGFQSAGEPFCDYERLVAADEAVRAAAARHGVSTYSYITSNGTMAREQYCWAAERFDRICISIDGSPETHDSARRFRDRRPTFAKARETVQSLERLGKLPACRSTITRDTVEQMAKSAEFLFGELGLREVQFEPVYYHSRLWPKPERFVEQLTRAREIARRYHGQALYSGFRRADAHGRYCQTLRHVLFITPIGTASSCLFRESENRESPFTIAALSDKGDTFEIDQHRVAAFNAIVTQLPEACRSCPLCDHCTRGCPDFCPLDPGFDQSNITRSLGCRINRLLFAEEERSRVDNAAVERVPAFCSELPEPLVNALNELSQKSAVTSTTQAYLTAWTLFLNSLGVRLPSAKIEDEQATVRVGELSPGCVYCKQGLWDCIFVTWRCNLSCRFCHSPKTFKRKGFSSGFGKSIDEVIDNYLRAGICGVGLSGGEALLEPARTFSLIERLRRKLGDRYLWLYTNGLLLHQDHMARLADLGLNEIRFNTRATGNTDPIVLRTMARAAERIPTVTIEIPAIPGDAQTIIIALCRWADAGVKHLNLHELMREQQSNSARLEGEFDRVVLVDGHTTEISRQSREVAAAVIRAVVDKGIPIAVNFCSFTNKLLQLRVRRKALAALHQKPYERLDGEVIETVLAFTAPDNYAWMHPDEVERLKGKRVGQRFFLLRRVAPLILDDPGRLLAVQEVT